MLGRHDELDLSGTQPSSSSSFHLRSRFEPFLLTMLIKPTIAAGRHLARQHHCAGLAPALTPRTFTMTKPSYDDDDDDDGDDDDDEGRVGGKGQVDHKAHHGDDGHTTASTMGHHYGPALRASTTGQHDGPARRASTTG